jgi:MtN3 and saliva related transmembrane protein|tara:strand:- start:10707 stop:10865 length:159 start_codon:yes stop_codon:yes gene_type:complete
MNWINYIGLIAAALTTSCMLPQAIKTIKTKSTKDISLLMYSILIIGVIFWLI